MMDQPKPKVYVAMSGGVDSSVAAALLKKQGFDLDYKKLKEVHLIKKVNGVLAIFGKNMTYEKMIRGTVSGITDV